MSSAIIRQRHASAPKTAKKESRKKEWNQYLTDSDKYKIDKNDVLRRKKLFISKHSIYSENFDPRPIKTSANKRNKKFIQKKE